MLAPPELLKRPRLLPSGDPAKALAQLWLSLVTSLVLVCASSWPPGGPSWHPWVAVRWGHHFLQILAVIALCFSLRQKAQPRMWMGSGFSVPHGGCQMTPTIKYVRAFKISNQFQSKVLRISVPLPGVSSPFYSYPFNNFHSREYNLNWKHV